GFPSGVASAYNFSCIVADAVTGCIDTVVISYNVVAGLNMSVTGPPQLCLGDSVTLIASGANTFGWSANPAYPFSDSTQATPVVTTAPSTVCATQPNPHTIFTVTGASAGSSYGWALSPNYFLISSANADSSAITISFPVNAAATYQFVAVVHDATTGCDDTIP